MALLPHDIDVAAAQPAPADAPDVAGLPGGVEEEPWPSPRRAWYGVGVFALALLSLFMGNGVLTLLIQPIEHDLHLSDVGVSLIVGAALSAFNALFSLPVSRLVDIVSRRVLIGIGLLVSGLSSALSGVSGTFWQLFLARMCGGIGGSANGPATFSMLADYFPPAKLPKALAIMNIGTYYGQAGALLLGGTLIAVIMKMHHIELPFLGTLRPWQLVFLVLAVPDLLLGILVLTTLHEPRRRGVRSGRPAAAGRAVQRVVPVREVFTFLLDNRSAFGPMFLGLALTSLDAGTLIWLPTFFQRTYGWSPAFYGIVSGTLLLIAAPIGLIAGGVLAEKLALRGYDDANLRVVFIAALARLPFALTFAFMPNPYLALALSTIDMTIVSMGPGPQNAALQSIVPNEMRGQVTALFLFFFTMIGLALAPTVVAALTDYVFGAPSMLRYSIAVLHLALGPAAVLIFGWGLAPYGRAYAQARQWR